MLCACISELHIDPVNVIIRPITVHICKHTIHYIYCKCGFSYRQARLQWVALHVHVYDTVSGAPRL